MELFKLKYIHGKKKKKLKVVRIVEYTFKEALVKFFVSPQKRGLL